MPNKILSLVLALIIAAGIFTFSAAIAYPEGHKQDAQVPQRAGSPLREASVSRAAAETTQSPSGNIDARFSANGWKYSYASSGQMFQAFYFFYDDGIFVNDHLGLWPRKFVGNYHISEEKIYFTNIKQYNKNVGSAVFGNAGLDTYAFHAELPDLTSQFEFGEDDKGGYLRVATVHNQTQLGYADHSNLKIHRISGVETGK